MGTRPRAWLLGFPSQSRPGVPPPLPAQVWGCALRGAGPSEIALERSRELAELRALISGGRAARWLIGRRGLPGWRAPHAAAAAAAAQAKGMEVPTLGSGLGACSGPLSRARHRRGGRAVIRVIARLHTRGCSEPQAAQRGRGRGRPNPWRGSFLQKSCQHSWAARAKKGLLGSALWGMEGREED